MKLNNNVVLVQVKSVQLIADGKAPRIPQTEEGASYEGIQKKSNAKVRDLTLNSASKSDIFRLFVKNVNNVAISVHTVVSDFNQ